MFVLRNQQILQLQATAQSPDTSYSGLFVQQNANAVSMELVPQQQQQLLLLLLLLQQPLLQLLLVKKNSNTNITWNIFVNCSVISTNNVK